MTTNVLHGEGKPRLIIPQAFYDAQGIRPAMTDTVGSVYQTYTIVFGGTPALSSALVGKQLITKNSYDQATKGKIISYSNGGNAVTVDFWDNLLPAAGKTITITNYVIDLPYCEQLVETFKPDLYPVKKLWNTGRKVVKLRGYYYYAALDYSSYTELSTLQPLQDVYNALRTQAMIFLPRRDNPNVNYSVEIDPDSGDLTLQQLTRHQGHKGLIIRLIGLDRLSKVDLTSSLLDNPGEHNIISSDEIYIA